MSEIPPKAARPFLHVGLTGGIACGKTVVSDLLQGFGVPVIDSDVLAREVVMPGREAYRDIVAAFGRKILQPDGSLDRKALGGLVFSDSEARRALERITHPRIRSLAEERLRDLAARPEGARPDLVVEVIPLLFEVGLEGRFDEVWVVTCEAATQRRRLALRDGMDEAAVEARLAAQMPLAEKEARAVRVMRNDGDRHALEARVGEVLREARDAWRARSC